MISTIGIQVHDVNALPVACGAFPAQRMKLARGLVEYRAAIQDVLITVRMTLGRCYQTDRAVTMFVVVPAHQFCDPVARVEQGIERFEWISGPVLQGFEQRFRKGDM